MEKDNFIKLLERDSPEEILDYIKRHGKKSKSVAALIFYDDQEETKVSE